MRWYLMMTWEAWPVARQSYLTAAYCLGQSRGVPFKNYTIAAMLVTIVTYSPTITAILSSIRPVTMPVTITTNDHTTTAVATASYFCGIIPTAIHDYSNFVFLASHYVAWVNYSDFQQTASSIASLGYFA